MSTAQALSAAQRIVKRLRPWSLEFAARAAARVGGIARVLEKARRSRFVADQATWVQAASATESSSRQEIADLVNGLAPRVVDELDFGREHVAGLPLLVALARKGHGEALLHWAVEWRVPPPLLAEHLLLFAREGVHAVGESSQVRRLLALPRAEWSIPAAGDASFWDEGMPPGPSRTRSRWRRMCRGGWCRAPSWTWCSAGEARRLQTPVLERSARLPRHGPFRTA